MKVLVIGAAGNVGLAALKSCLRRGHDVTAFVRNPSKLPEQVTAGPNFSLFKGDATNKSDLVQAMQGQDAVIQAAVYGSNTPWGTSDSEKVVSNIVEAVKEVQSKSPARQSPIRLWVLSGQVLLEVPGQGGKIEGDFLPIHPEHYSNYAYLQEHADELDWSLLCPGKIDEVEPAGPLEITLDHIGLYHPPFVIGRIPFIGPTLNIIYNFSRQRLSYRSVGDFLADNLGPGNEMRRRRIGILEKYE